MRATLSAMFALALAVVCTAPIARANDAPASETAIAFIDRLDRGEFEAATEGFTPRMKAGLEPAAIRALWTALPAQVGPRSARGPTRERTEAGHRVVIVPLVHEKATLDAEVVVDAGGRIAGFFVKPAAAPVAAPAAERSTAAPEAESRELSIGTGERALPGTLLIPNGAKRPVPVVVLVHGSGPHDRDETVGPNRPFRDIAEGLAAHGIATLRYEKRTKARPQDFTGRFDMDDETTNDAVLAVAALRDVPGIDAARIHVLGHSLGGMLAPRIAAQSGQVAGLILLAAPARRLLDVLPDQFRRLAGQDGAVSAEEQAQLDRLARQITAVRGDGDLAASETPLGLPVHYWRAIDRIDPIADARATKLPILLLHGGRDIQVTETDWALWRKAMDGRPGVTLRHYPALSHLAIAGEGAGSLMDYQTPGKVDAGLIADIAQWITRLPH